MIKKCYLYNRSLYLDINVLARRLQNAFLRNITNPIKIPLGVNFCVYSCKYIKLWYLELMIVSKIQSSNLAARAGEF